MGNGWELDATSKKDTVESWVMGGDAVLGTWGDFTDQSPPLSSSLGCGVGDCLILQTRLLRLPDRQSAQGVGAEMGANAGCNHWGSPPHRGGVCPALPSTSDGPVSFHSAVPAGHRPLALVSQGPETAILASWPLTCP